MWFFATGTALAARLCKCRLSLGQKQQLCNNVGHAAEETGDLLGEVTHHPTWSCLLIHVPWFARAVAVALAPAVCESVLSPCFLPTMQVLMHMLRLACCLLAARCQASQSLLPKPQDQCMSVPHAM